MCITWIVVGFCPRFCHPSHQHANEKQPKQYGKVWHFTKRALDFQCGHFGFAYNLLCKWQIVVGGVLFTRCVCVLCATADTYYSIWLWLRSLVCRPRSDDNTLYVATKNGQLVKSIYFVFVKRLDFHIRYAIWRGNCLFETWVRLDWRWFPKSVHLITVIHWIPFFLSMKTRRMVLMEPKIH